MTDTQKPEALRLHRELLYLAAKNAGTAKERMFAALTKSAAELYRLQAENEALRADAERYRWLRSAVGQWEHPIVVSQRREGDCMHYVGPLGFRELDAAIDAAMKENP